MHEDEQLRGDDVRERHWHSGKLQHFVVSRHTCNGAKTEREAKE